MGVIIGCGTIQKTKIQQNIINIYIKVYNTKQWHKLIG